MVAPHIRTLRHLGGDALASSYEARDATGALVLVSVMHARLAHDPRLRDRFLRAKAVARSVAHRGLVRVLEDGVALDGRPYLVTERVGGETLESRIRRGPVLGAREAVRIAVDLLAVLDAAHEA
ncbi:MAG TPA: serine/threonine protein kinase, partial [Labilithrix sp.]|nr:serine/threonine protein kinase [Labilithrix sp.]